jgi:cellulose synthase/poly-beta-1,6-N-acetylglucosamine synthase-like glycosyltransferase
VRDDESLVVDPAPPSVLSRGQKVFLSALLVFVVIAGVLAPMATIVGVNAALIVVFSAGALLKLFLIRRAVRDAEVRRGIRPAGELGDTELPVYTILLPVYREGNLLRQLVAGIEALDYPRGRLDVKLLLEEDDLETQEAASRLALPSYVECLVVPDVGPRGKPRACNVGLAHARGDLLVIYDAEDRPERDQLRKAAAAFGELRGTDIVCLQAKLNYFNRSYNALTRLFTAEYSMWFDLLLPGLQSLDAVIPLGGTSNHFSVECLRELGGWNSYNVTEDADLGVRIYQAGWKTAILDSTTYEEANSRYGNWIRQRSRWVKGYMQTYLFYMRHPMRLARQTGLRAFIVFQLFVGAGSLCLLINPFYWALTAVWYLTHLGIIQQSFPWPVLYLGTMGLFIGNAAFVLTAIAGCYSRRNYGDVKWVLLMPAYWLLMSIAAWKAFVQLCYKPSYWEKTVHGYCTIDDDSNDAVILLDRENTALQDVRGATGGY